VASHAASGVGGVYEVTASGFREGVLMPLVVPSDVVRVIERLFPDIVKDPKARPGFGVDILPPLQAIVNPKRRIRERSQPHERPALGGVA
jgi:hypothetical protein